MAWQVFLPAISPWIDLRPYAGMQMTSYSGCRLKENVSFLRSVFWFYLGGSLIWQNNTSAGNPCYGAYSISYTSVTNSLMSCLGRGSDSYTTTTTGNSFFGSYGITRDSSSVTRYGSTGRHLYVDVSSSNMCVLLPSRPLEKDPVATESCNATVSTTLTGISYRTSYAHRRSWRFSVLLDGPMDTNRPEYFADARPVAIRNFLKYAESGVTVHLQGRNPKIRDMLVATQAPYLGCANSISGQLTGASWTLSGQDDKAYRYKIDLDLDEDPNHVYAR